MKLLQLVNSVEAMNVLATSKLPAKVSYKIGTFLAKAAPEIDSYNKVKNTKLDEYAEPVMEKGKATGRYTFPDKKKAELYVKEMTEVENGEVNLEIPEVRVKDLGDNQIEPKHLVALEWLIKE